MLKLLIVALAISSHYEDSLQKTDSCKTLSYNSMEMTICTDSRDLLTRAREQAEKTNMTIEEYIYTSILERIEYDEEETDNQ